MIESDLIDGEARKALNDVTKSLAYQYKGTFSQETIDDIVLDSYRKRAANATVTRWLVLGTSGLLGSGSTCGLHGESYEHISPSSALPVHPQCRALANGPRVVQSTSRRSRGRLVGWVRTSV